MLLSAVIFLFLQIALGVLFTNFLDRDGKLNRAERFFASIVTGLGLSSFILLLFLLVSRSWSVSILLLWIILIVAGIFVIWKIFRFTNFKTVSTIRFSFLYSPTLWGVLGGLSLYIAILILGFLVDSNGFPSVTRAGWSDSAYHLDMVTFLKTSDPFFLKHPVISGEPLTYPFLINLLTALYEVIGFPQIIAWHIPLLLFGVSFFMLIFLIGKRIFSNKVYALVLVFLVFFGGGIGFLWFFQNLWVAGNDGGINEAVSTFLNPPHQYTFSTHSRVGETNIPFDPPPNILWVVPSIELLSHQRAFPAGAALAALIILGFITYRGTKDLWRWAFVLGLMPLFHTHTFVALLLILICWFFYDIKNCLTWAKGGILAVILILPQVAYLIPLAIGSGSSTFFKPWIGWMMCTHDTKWYACDTGVEGIDTNIIWFWTKNFGSVFWVWVLAICAFLIFRGDRKKDYRSKVKPFMFPSLLLFIIPNFVLFQPWAHDNNKILFFWWIFASFCTIIFLQKFFVSRRIIKYLIICYLIFSTTSGMIDVLNSVLRYKGNHFGYYGTKEVEVSRWIHENTETSDRFLTGDNANQFVAMLTGRPIYLGYPGWIWSQGRGDLLKSRSERAHSFLKTGNPTLICEDEIKYVLWDNDLLRTYPRADIKSVLSVAEVVFSQKLESETREILEIRCPNS